MPICSYGDVEKMWKKREKLRDPALSEQENADLLRPYFGNPFKAPGTLAVKPYQLIIKVNNCSSQMKAYLKMADESFYQKKDKKKEI